MNPFMQYASGGSSSVTVNSIKPNARSNIPVPLSSLSDVNIIKESLSNGEILSWTDGKLGKSCKLQIRIHSQFYKHYLKKGVLMVMQD